MVNGWLPPTGAQSRFDARIENGSARTFGRSLTQLYYRPRRHSRTAFAMSQSRTARETSAMVATRAVLIM